VTNNWIDYKATIDRVPELLSPLEADQTVVVFHGMAKPVPRPLTGPTRPH